MKKENEDFAGKKLIVMKLARGLEIIFCIGFGWRGE
jgi:hypothetical protein